MSLLLNGYIFSRTFSGTLQLTNLQSLNAWTNALLELENPSLHPVVGTVSRALVAQSTRFPAWKPALNVPEEKDKNEARTHCVDLPVANLKHSSPGGIVILVFTVVGMVVTLSSFAVTCRFWNTPIVKASNRKFSIVLMISILLLLTLVVINLLKPSDTTCKIIYPWRYITYNLCLSFLVVKILRISSAFQIPLARSLVAISLTNRMQVVIIITMHILLLLLLLPWQLLDPPVKKRHILTDQYIFIECKAYSVLVGKSFFLVTCSYILIQIFFAAFCSFKIRKVPENFSEVKRIAFSMFGFSLLPGGVLNECMVCDCRRLCYNAIDCLWLNLLHIITKVIYRLVQARAEQFKLHP